MSKTNKSRRDEKRRRAARQQRRDRQHPSAEPDLIADIRSAIVDPDPLSLLTYVSMLLYVTDPRRKHPFADPDAPEAMGREELIGTFIDVPIDETTALLAVLSEMVGDDDILRARIRRELAMRPKLLELAWLDTLSQIETYRAVLMSHVLGDGDNIILGARLAGGHEMTCSVYIDHNVGTLVKDAFVVSEPIAGIVEKYQQVAEDPDARWDDLSLADAKARIVAAIDRAAITVPPFETETWPACRALIEWVTRRLPDGGVGYEWHEWESEALASLAERFFNSEVGAPLDDRDHRDLLDSLLWYATDYGSGDPMRWSPVKVEILIGDWLPRKIVAPVRYLALAPDLLRAFVRFAHSEVGLRRDLTREALTAIDAWEPEYQSLIRSPRPKGPGALLAAMGLDVDDTASLGDVMLDQLASDVGGRVELDRLDDHPLPGESFRWDGIADDIVERVQEVLALTDRCCDERLDVEVRTACRRLLSRAAAGDAEAFRRKGKPEMGAAAIVWIIGKVNDLFSPWPGGVHVKDIMSHFGLTGSASQRAATLLRAGGFDCETHDIHLGSPDFLTSSARRRIIESRDGHYQPSAL